MSMLMEKSVTSVSCQVAVTTADIRTYFGLLLEHIPVLASVVTPTGDVLFASRHHALLFDVSNNINELTEESELYPASARARLQQLQSTSAVECEWELTAKHKDGSTHLYKMRRTRIACHRLLPGYAGEPEIQASSDDVIYTVGVDITEDELAESVLRDHKSHLNFAIFHDPLTGLANRSLFYDRVNKSIARAKRTKSSLALMLLDLDRFKNVNDSLGHEAGDRYLKAVAQHLVDELRDTDTVARLGGDEFVVVLENVTCSESIEAIATKLLGCLQQPVVIQGHPVSCTASIGISVFPHDGDSIDQLLKHADTAMYRAKAAGKNRAQFYVSAMSDSAVNYLLLENDLRRALEQNELRVFYQPQVDLNTGRITGLEALVRWQHKDRGLMSPVHFIPLAEETGLIEPLGAWVLEQACARFQHWLAAGIDLCKVAVNLSTRQFRQEGFEHTVAQVLRKTGLPAKCLELEITESSAMENAANTINMLNCLSDMGLSLAIDDFGTGYSSLAYLQRFPIQKLKIDRSFITNVDRDDQEAAIAKSIIDLAHNMSLEVIAEGVERASQCQWLGERGCDQVQGYFYSKPLSEEALMNLVSDSESVICDASGVRLLSQPLAKH